MIGGGSRCVAMCVCVWLCDDDEEVVIQEQTKKENGKKIEMQTASQVQPRSVN